MPRAPLPGQEAPEGSISPFREAFEPEGGGGYMPLYHWQQQVVLSALGRADLEELHSARRAGAKRSCCAAGARPRVNPGVFARGRAGALL
jgi:hypothetical protein